jgi:hypothetical protein
MLPHHPSQDRHHQPFARLGRALASPERSEQRRVGGAP